MTAQNMAKFRLDPNIDFWNLKMAPTISVTKNEPSVLVSQALCLRRDHEGRGWGSEPCPALARSEC